MKNHEQIDSDWKNDGEERKSKIQREQERRNARRQKNSEKEEIFKPSKLTSQK